MLYIEPRYTMGPSSGGNTSVKAYGAKRAAFSMAVATFAMTSPSQAALNDAATPLRPVRDFASQASLRAVERRFAELCEIAEEEGIEINRDAYRSLKNFVRSWLGIRAPAIMLMDDGTTRAVWRCANEQQVALHFRDNGKVQYVVFVLDDEGKMERATGLTNISGIARKLLAFRVQELLTNDPVA